MSFPLPTYSRCFGMEDGREAVNTSIKLMRTPVRKSLKGKKRSKTFDELHETQSARTQFQQPAEERKENNVNVEKSTVRMSSGKRATSVEEVKTTGFTPPVSCRKRSHSEQQVQNHPHPFFRYAQSNGPPRHGIGQTERQEKAAEGLAKSVAKKPTFRESNQKYILAVLNKQKSDSALKKGGSLLTGLDDDRPINDMPRNPTNSVANQVLNQTSNTSLLPKTPFKLYYNTITENNTPKEKAQDSVNQVVETVWDKVAHSSNRDGIPNNRLPPRKTSVQNKYYKINSPNTSKESTTATEQPRHKAVHCSDPDSLPNNYIPPKKPAPRSMSADRGISADAICKDNLPRREATIAAISTKQFKNKAVYCSDPDSLPNNYIPPKKPAPRSMSADRGISARAICKDNLPRREATIAAISTKQFKNKVVHCSDPDSLPNNYIPPKKTSRRSQSLDRGIFADVTCKDNLPRKGATIATVTTEQFKKKAVNCSDPDSLPNNSMPPKKHSRSQSLDRGIYANTICMVSRKTVTGECIMNKQFKKNTEYCSDPDSLPNNCIPPRMCSSRNAAKGPTTTTEWLPYKVEHYREPDRLPTNSIPKKCSTSNILQAEENKKVNIIKPMLKNSVEISDYENVKMKNSTQKVDTLRFRDPPSLPTNRIPRKHDTIPKIEKFEKRPHNEELPKNKMPKSRSPSKIIKPVSRAASVDVKKKTVIPVNAKLANETKKPKQNIDADLRRSNAQVRMEELRNRKQQPMNRKQESTIKMHDDIMKRKVISVRRSLSNQTLRTSKVVTSKTGHKTDPPERVRSPLKLNKEPVSRNRPTTVNREKTKLIKPTGRNQSQGTIKLEQEARRVRASSVGKAQARARKAAEPPHPDEQSNQVGKSQAIEIAAEPSNVEKRSNTVGKEQAIEMKPAQPPHLEERSNAVGQEQAIEVKPPEQLDHEEHSNTTGKERAIERESAQPTKAFVVPSSEDIPKQGQEIPSKPKQETLKYESPKSFKKLTEHELKLKRKVTKDPPISATQIGSPEAVRLRREAIRAQTLSLERKVARKRTVESYSRDVKHQPRPAKSLTRIRKSPWPQQKLKYESQPPLKKGPVIREREQNNKSKSIVYRDKDVVLKQMGEKHEIPKHVKQELAVETQLHITPHTTDTISSQGSGQVTAKPAAANVSTERDEKPSLEENKLYPDQRQVQDVLQRTNKKMSTKSTKSVTSVKSTNKLQEQLEHEERIQPFDCNVQKESVDEDKKTSRKTVSLISTRELLEQQATKPIDHGAPKQCVGQHKKSTRETKSLMSTNELLEQQEATQPSGYEVPKQFVDQQMPSAREAPLLTTTNELLEQGEPTKLSDHQVTKQFVGQNKKRTAEAASLSSVHELLEKQEPTKAINNEMPKQFVGKHKKGTYTQTNKEKRSIDIAKQPTSSKKVMQPRASRDKFMQDSSNKTATRPFERKTSRSRLRLPKPPPSRPHSMGDVLVEKKVRATNKNVLEAEDKEVSRHKQVSQDEEAKKQEQVRSIVNEYDRSIVRVSRYPNAMQKLRKHISEQALQTTGQQTPRVVIPPTTQTIPPGSNSTPVVDFDDYSNYHPNLQRFIPDRVVQNSLRERLARPTTVALPPPHSQSQQRLPQSRVLVKPQRTVVKPRATVSGTGRPKAGSSEQIGTGRPKAGSSEQIGTGRPKAGSSEQIKADRTRPYAYQQYKAAIERTSRTRVMVESHNKPEKSVLYQQLKKPLQQQSMHDWSKSDKIGKSKKPASAEANGTLKPPVVECKLGDDGGPAEKVTSSHDFTSAVVTKSVDQSKSGQHDTPNQLSPGPLIPNVLKPSEANREANVANIVTKEPTTATVKVGKGIKPAVPNAPFRLEDDDEFEFKYEETRHPTIKPHPGEMWINEIDSGNVTETTVNITAGQTNPRSMHTSPSRLDDKPRSDILATRKTNVEFNSNIKLSEPTREAQGGVKPDEKPSLASDKTPATVNLSTVANNTSTVVDKMLGAKGASMEGAIKTPAALNTTTVTSNTSTAVDKTSGVKGASMEGANKTPAALNTTTVTSKTSTAVDKTSGVKGASMEGAKKTPAALNMTTVTNKTSTVVDKMSGAKGASMEGANKTPAALNTTTVTSKTSTAVDKTLGVKGASMEGVNKTPAALNMTTVTNKTSTAVDKMSGAKGTTMEGANKTPAALNTTTVTSKASTAIDKTSGVKGTTMEGVNKTPAALDTTTVTSKTSTVIDKTLGVKGTTMEGATKTPPALNMTTVTSKASTAIDKTLGVKGTTMEGANKTPAAVNTTTVTSKTSTANDKTSGVKGTTMEGANKTPAALNMTTVTSKTSTANDKTSGVKGTTMEGANKTPAALDTITVTSKTSTVIDKTSGVKGASMEGAKKTPAALNMTTVTSKTSTANDKTSEAKGASMEGAKKTTAALNMTTVTSKASTAVDKMSGAKGASMEGATKVPAALNTTTVTSKTSTANDQTSGVKGASMEGAKKTPAALNMTTVTSKASTAIDKTLGAKGASMEGAKKTPAALNMTTVTSKASKAIDKTSGVKGASMEGAKKTPAALNMTTVTSKASTAIDKTSGAKGTTMEGVNKTPAAPLNMTTVTSKASTAIDKTSGAKGTTMEGVNKTPAALNTTTVTSKASTAVDKTSGAKGTTMEGTTKSPAALDTTTVTSKTSTAVDKTLGVKGTTMEGANKTPAAPLNMTTVTSKASTAIDKTSGAKGATMESANKTPPALDMTTVTSKTSTAIDKTSGAKGATMEGANKTPAALDTTTVTSKTSTAIDKTSGAKGATMEGATKSPAALDTTTVTSKTSTAVDKMSGAKGATMEGATKTPPALNMTTVTSKTSTAIDKTLGAKGATMEVATKTTPAAVKTSMEVGKSAVTPHKTQSAANITSTAANKTTTVANKDTKVTANPPAATKPKKPFRLEDDDEFELKIEEMDRHPKIKPASDAMWLEKANVGEIFESTVNRPEGQNHPRQVNVKLPPHPEMRPLRDCAWVKRDELGEISEKTVSFAGNTAQPSIINVKHSLKDNRPPQYSKTSQAPQTQPKEIVGEPPVVVPERKQPGWQPEILKKAVVEASKGLPQENNKNRAAEAEQGNIEDLILAQLNLKPEGAPAKPAEPAKVFIVSPQNATTQQKNVPSKLQLVKPTYADESLDPGVIIQREEDREPPGSFRSQINRKEFKRLIEMEFQRINNEGKGPGKPGAKVKSGIELYHTPANMPDLPDVDSLISNKRDGAKLVAQTPTPQLNIKMLREEIDELKRIGKTKEKPPAVWQPQRSSTTDAKSVELPQQLIDKIPVQGKEESGMADESCTKPIGPPIATEEANVRPTRFRDERPIERPKIATMKPPKLAGMKPNTPAQSLQDTLEEVGSTMMKHAMTASTQGQTVGKTLQSEIKTYVKDLYKTGGVYLQQEATRRVAQARQAVRQHQQQQQQPRYGQIKYPVRLRTHSGGRTEARPSTSSGEAVPAAGARGAEEGKPPPPPSAANRPPPPPVPPKEGYFPPCENCDNAAEAARSGGEPPLTGLSKHFNSSTIRGRANVAKATFALIGLYTVYRMLRKEPREY